MKVGNKTMFYATLRCGANKTCFTLRLHFRKFHATDVSWLSPSDPIGHRASIRYPRCNKGVKSCSLPRRELGASCYSDITGENERGYYLRFKSNYDILVECWEQGRRPHAHWNLKRHQNGSRETTGKLFMTADVTGDMKSFGLIPWLLFCRAHPLFQSSLFLRLLSYQ